MSELIQQSKLHLEMKDFGFLSATQAQIKKDFSSVNTDFTNSFDDAVQHFDELIDQVVHALSIQFTLGERQTLQLMYQIDIPESQFLSLAQEEDFVLELAQKIIYREAYKVYLRRKFSA